MTEIWVYPNKINNRMATVLNKMSGTRITVRTAAINVITCLFTDASSGENWCCSFLPHPTIL